MEPRRFPFGESVEALVQATTVAAASGLVRAVLQTFSVTFKASKFPEAGEFLTLSR